MKYRLDNVQIIMIVAIALGVVTLFFSLVFGKYLISHFAGTVAFLLFGILCLYTGFRDKRPQRQDELHNIGYPIHFIWLGILIILMTIIYTIVSLIH